VKSCEAITAREAIAARQAIAAREAITGDAAAISANEGQVR
jgi:hypothetical protein